MRYNYLNCFLVLIKNQRFRAYHLVRALWSWILRLKWFEGVSFFDDFLEEIRVFVLNYTSRGHCTLYLTKPNNNDPVCMYLIWYVIDVNVIWFSYKREDNLASYKIRFNPPISAWRKVYVFIKLKRTFLFLFVWTFDFGI